MMIDFYKIRNNLLLKFMKMKKKLNIKKEVFINNMIIMLLWKVIAFFASLEIFILS